MFKMLNTTQTSEAIQQLKQAKRSNSSIGFTLIELLVVISVIAILAGFGFANYGPSQKRARDGKRKVDLEQIRSALEMYRTDSSTRSYPATGTEQAELASYLSWPTDPTTGYTYYYNRSATSAYVLCAYLEADSSGSCAASCGAETCNYQVSNP